MSYFKQFEQTHPLDGYVPGYPFSYLPEIAQRARSMINGLSFEKIDLIAREIDQQIEGYFQDEKDRAIIELKDRLCPQPSTFDTKREFESYFEWDGDEDVGRWVFKKERLEDLDIPTENNCNEMDALKNIVENSGYQFFFTGDTYPQNQDDLTECKNYQLFSVLALWLVADAIEWSKTDNKYHQSIAAGYAIKAMEAISYADHLREKEWVIDAYQRLLKNTQATFMEEARKKLQEEFEVRDKQRKSELAKQMNLSRHAATKRAKEAVLKEWEGSKDKFLSAEKAGGHYADWLVERGMVKSIEQRTVTSWIRAHAKAAGLRLR